MTTDSGSVLNESKPEKENSGVTSLSFDQVNDDADELVELRGEGRYFGVTDPSDGTTINAQQSLGPLCGNCHKRGHIRSKCKTVVCHKCGVVGDHYETQCPTTIKCAKCGEMGHIASSCKSKKRKRTYCKSCDTFSHDDLSCPNIWRSYITKPDSQEESSVLPRIYCYNCASQDHYGDECKEARISRVPNFGSAFSGSNLPRRLRPLYFHRLSSAREKPNRNYSSNSNPKKGNRGKTYDDFNSYGKPDFNSRDYNSNRGPSRSGVLKARKNAKTNKPTRSGVIDNKKKTRMMY